MTWKEYIEEIELIEKQNNVEHDLYNIIANVLKERLAFKKVSLRDVGDRRRTDGEKEKAFWGLLGFPDFVILSKDYNPTAESIDRELIYGAVEAKYVGCKLLSNDKDLSQLIGHLLWFKFVIYTNGIEWRIYNRDWDNVSDEKIDELHEKTYSNCGSKQEEKEKCENVKRILKHFKLQDLTVKSFIIRKVDKYNNIEWDYSEWKKLIKYLNHINFS